MSAAATAGRTEQPGQPGPGPSGRDGKPPGPPGRASRAGWLREMARAAAGPVACAAVLIGLLSVWVASGGGGTITPVRIQIIQAAVPMRSYPGAGTPSGAARTFLTIWNPTGQPDELLSVHSPVARTIVLRRSSGPEDPGSAVAELAIPARTRVTLTPFGSDVILTDPVRFEGDSTVPLTLTFRHAGQVTVTADVTAPGTP